MLRKPQVDGRWVMLTVNGLNNVNDKVISGLIKDSILTLAFRIADHLEVR